MKILYPRDYSFVCIVTAETNLSYVLKFPDQDLEIAIPKARVGTDYFWTKEEAEDAREKIKAFEAKKAELLKQLETEFS